jgi:AraC-like DNA-binding protein
MDDHSLGPFARHLPAEADAIRWGIYVVDCGFNRIEPGSVYPATPEKHLPDYLFTWKEGRTLDEYQLVYISKGRGVFETEETGRVRVEEGQAFLLFPGVWHRFRPVKTVGWDENWIGFKGDVADRIMDEFFSPEKAVIRVGQDQELLHLMRSIVGITDAAPAGFKQIMGARALEALAIVRSRSMNIRRVDREVAKKVQKARQYLVEHYRESIDTEALARKLGLSISRFRAVFKEHTGVAPHQYQIDVRMNLARHWLTESSHSISEIADMLGFSSVFYFSRLFKRKEGVSPSVYRKR